MKHILAELDKFSVNDLKITLAALEVKRSAPSTPSNSSVSTDIGSESLSPILELDTESLTQIESLLIEMVSSVTNLVQIEKLLIAVVEAFEALESDFNEKMRRQSKPTVTFDAYHLADSLLAALPLDNRLYTHDILEKIDHLSLIIHTAIDYIDPKKKDFYAYTIYNLYQAVETQQKRLTDIQHKLVLVIRSTSIQELTQNLIILGETLTRHFPHIGDQTLQAIFKGMDTTEATTFFIKHYSPLKLAIQEHASELTEGDEIKLQIFTHLNLGIFFCEKCATPEVANKKQASLEKIQAAITAQAKIIREKILSAEKEAQLKKEAEQVASIQCAASRVQTLKQSSEISLEILTDEDKKKLQDYVEAIKISFSSIQTGHTIELLFELGKYLRLLFGSVSAETMQKKLLKLNLSVNEDKMTSDSYQVYATLLESINDLISDYALPDPEQNITEYDVLVLSNLYTGILCFPYAAGYKPEMILKRLEKVTIPARQFGKEILEFRYYKSLIEDIQAQCIRLKELYIKNVIEKMIAELSSDQRPMFSIANLDELAFQLCNKIKPPTSFIVPDSMQAALLIYRFLNQLASTLSDLFVAPQSIITTSACRLKAYNFLRNCTEASTVFATLQQEESLKTSHNQLILAEQKLRDHLATQEKCKKDEFKKLRHVRGRSHSFSSVFSPNLARSPVFIEMTLFKTLEVRSPLEQNTPPIAESIASPTENCVQITRRKSARC